MRSTWFAGLCALLLGCQSKSGPDTPADLADLIGQLATLQQGGQVDLDGDGTNETSSSVNGDGTIHVEIDFNGDGKPEYSGDEGSDGSGSAWIDRDEDGKHEWEESDQAGPPLVWVTLDDLDGDGRLETRTTQTIDPSAGTNHVLVERDASGTGSFATISDDTFPEDEFQSVSDCDPVAGFPTNTVGRSSISTPATCCSPATPRSARPCCTS
jgi:hypothetical protein